MKKQSFVMGAVVLTICAVVCKLLGAIYRIPLTNILGVGGMGLYYLIFPIYSFMLTVSSSSFPMAISHLVSVSIANGNKKKAKCILKVSLLLLVLFGLFAAIAVFALARPLASLQGKIEASFGYLVIAPSLLFVALISAFRGYFQGLQNMNPSGVSQIVEQSVKMVFGLYLALKLSKYGVEYGVAGALLAITISECIACLYICLYYLCSKHKDKNDNDLDVCSKYSQASIAIEILKTVVPYMLGTIVYPLATLIDSFLIINLLTNSGVDSGVAVDLFGINCSVVGTMTNLPTIVSVALAISIIPSLTYSKKINDTVGVQSKTNFAIKITWLIVLPCAVVFILFARPIVNVLFAGGMDNSVFDQVGVSANLLSVAGVSVIYLCLMQVLTAILQAIKRPYIPVVSLSIGVVVKIILESVLIQVPALNIYGAVVSNIACYSIAAIINLYYVKKYIKLKLDTKNMLILPICCAAIMAGVVYGFMIIFVEWFGYTIGVILSFAIAAIAYIVLLFWFRVFTKSELKYFAKIKMSK